MKYILLISSVLWLTACKKEADVSSNTPNKPSTAGTDFVEFKIDGTPYRLEEVPYKSGDNMWTTSTAIITNSPSVSIHQVNFSFNRGLLSQNVNLRLASTEPFRVKKYQYSTFDAFNHPYFLYLTTLNTGYQTDISTLTTGSVEITKLDTLKGGTMEGTFSLNDVEKYTETNGVDKVLSRHTLTDGKFKVTFK